MGGGAHRVHRVAAARSSPFSLKPVSVGVLAGDARSGCTAGWVAEAVLAARRAGRGALRDGPACSNARAGWQQCTRAEISS